MKAFLPLALLGLIGCNTSHDVTVEDDIEVPEQYFALIKPIGGGDNVKRPLGSTTCGFKIGDEVKVERLRGMR